MEVLHTNEKGQPSHWTMTRKEFFALHTDRRNKPGRSGMPMALAYNAKDGGTWSVPVVYACKHGTLEKVRCGECETEQGCFELADPMR